MKKDKNFKPKFNLLKKKIRSI